MTRQQWFAALAALSYPADPSKAGLAFQPMMPWLADLPDAAFTRESCDHVVVAPRKMAIPSYDEIRKPLAAWWRDNRAAEVRLASDYPQLPGPTPEEKRPPTEAERAAVSTLVQSWKQDRAKKSGVFHLPEEQRPKAIPLADEALLLEYTRFANDDRNDTKQRRLAEIRIRSLRKKLGIEVRETVDA